MQVFMDRAHAGRVLAEMFRQRLEQKRRQVLSHNRALLPEKPDVVLALPRGGVPVAAPVAALLDAPLDVWVARKIGVPGHEELGMGAIAEGGGHFVHRGILRTLHIDEHVFAEVEKKEALELRRRVQKYRGRVDVLPLHQKFVWLIDDGMATGSTLLAATQGVLAQDPESLWVGIPVATQDSLHLLPDEIDEVICAHVPAELWSIGAFYGDFRQITDAEVIEILKSAKNRPHAHRGQTPLPPPGASPSIS